ncbi:photosystem II core complex proteins psbY chloroplastic [Prunus yedoensis var. nudiflora]|uniref:Photosystem II core complex proteins psbY chloroplastic n=1 Tax=Prunus yedoensis var. nudiflora TaxID=2094558 RepID=A0A314YJT9_PRUYE|nr:photosystem II core complex proteins psbY chloroplastic [Prunus yedoensis var. nudiflora]
MAATMATMAIINAKCMSINTPKVVTKLNTKPTSLLSLQNLPKGLTSSKPVEIPSINMSPLASTAIAGAIFSTLSSSDPAMAAQQIAQIAEGDNRGLALLLPLIPAIAWVLFNIFQPA